jgi:hypothetical protein
MGKVIYDGKRLIPAPFLSIQKNGERKGDGELIGKKYSISLRGTLVAFKGSPTSSGTWYDQSGYPADETIGSDSRLGALLRKQEALRELFSVDGRTLEVQSMDGTQPFKCNPRILSIDVNEGIWYDRVEYTINMEADKVYPEDDSTDGLPYISDFSESWNIDTNENQLENYDGTQTYTLRHSISARGKRFYDETGTLSKPAWEQAKSYIVPRLGFDSQILLSSGVINLPSYYRGYNLVRSEDIDEAGGGYSVSESWVISSGNAVETFNIKKEVQLESPYTTVTIDGEVMGFEDREDDMSIASSKWTNAQAKYASISGLAHTRAQNFTGLQLNINPLTFSQGLNPYNGTISYGVTYNNRPMNLIEGAKTEVISINDSRRGDVFASVFCIGRDEGPILQYMGASTEATRSLNIECIVPVENFSDRSVATIQSLIRSPRENPAYSSTIENLIYAVNPKNNGFTLSYKSSPQESWNFLTGQYSYNITWTYE